MNIVKEHPPISGLTISTKLFQNNLIQCFSLGNGTDISQEKYPTKHLFYVLDGSGDILVNDDQYMVSSDDCLLVEDNVLCGTRTDDGIVYVEIILGKENEMNQIVKSSEVFKLAELLPYQKDSIVNADIASNDTMKFVVMAFDEGTGLSPHAAPGDAIVFALEGEATIGYEGKDYPIKAGEQFRFDKGGMHAVTANGKFKMALLLVLK
jgi:mannose-6-phosphate isomerase-like protein (cupin superfamily)